MAARLMADSTVVSDMPEWVSIKAFYINGRFKATEQQIAAWHGAKVKINVTGDPRDGGDMLDVETGDATPDHIPGWFDARLSAGARFLGVYCNRDKFDACTAAIAHRGAHRWLATLDGTLLHTYHGVPVDACQFMGEAQLGLHIDLSVVFNDAWHPGFETEVPNAELAHLLHLSTLAQNAVGRVHAAARRL